jgi:hypothetical protein
VASANIYGLSAQSAAGAGAIIWTVPDTPINFSNDAVITNGQRIGLKWNQAPDDGSTPVIDYRLYYSLVNEAY